MFTIKFKVDGTLERYMPRFVAKGFTQIYSIDYMKKISPIAKLNTIRIMLSMATNLDWPLRQLDVKTIFLNGDLEEEVYISPPPSFEDKFGSLYGLKHSLRAWFDRFSKFVKNQGYLQAQSYHTLFVKSSNNRCLEILIVYVDDIILRVVKEETC